MLSFMIIPQIYENTSFIFWMWSFVKIPQKTNINTLYDISKITELVKNFYPEDSTQNKYLVFVSELSFEKNISPHLWLSLRYFCLPDPQIRKSRESESSYDHI